ncbi:protein VACUOLELESS GAMETOPHYTES [Beta vulgaris subsp. vulgaris]|uniref:protein VACUOLELESS GAMETOPHYTES n=1 Tax=Beta vulgaris subsp. vulgaris TaxID=3555 RepID=UPI002036F28C|nr:protein VACUOLELESS GAMETOPHYTES [Beta vulgaris subsp. vulgaris]
MDQVKWITHNKHTKHPLKEVYKNSKFECKICKCNGKEMRFRCDQCDFNIHSACATCPVSLSSFTHPEHAVELMERPNLAHKCHLCQKPITGMVYRCKLCKFFMHPVCSEFPEFLFKHVMHPPHTLKLQLMESSKCDVCDKSCKHWRYFCGICDVHIHVGCLSSKNNISEDDEGGFGEVLGVTILGEIASVIAGSIAGG